MPMYNLLEHCDNYTKASGSLCYQYRNEPFLNANGAIADFHADNNNSASFNFKTKIAGAMENDGTKTVNTRAPLKYLLHFGERLNCY